MKGLFVQLAKVLLRFALDKTVREALPRIYEKLDISVPIAIVNGAPPAVVESEISYLAKKFSDGQVSDTTIEALALLYNPVKNAVRTQRKAR
jgi:hypothetical protein